MPFYRRIPRKAKKEAKRPPDFYLWPIFSLYIRLRDSDEKGYCKCFTCGAIRFFRDGDCGHGHGRQHWGTKYNEKNNHFQCKLCNGPGEGRKDVYARRMDEKYGRGTWENLYILSKLPCKWSRFEFDAMAIHYMQEIKKLLAGKHLARPFDLEPYEKKISIQ